MHPLLVKSTPIEAPLWLSYPLYGAPDTALPWWGKGGIARHLRLQSNRTLPSQFRRRRRDVGIGRQERLKIFCPVMGVPVRPRLAVRKIARTSGDFFCKLLLCLMSRQLPKIAFWWFNSFYFSSKLECSAFICAYCSWNLVSIR